MGTSDSFVRRSIRAGVGTSVYVFLYVDGNNLEKRFFGLQPLVSKPFANTLLNQTTKLGIKDLLYPQIL